MAAEKGHTDIVKLLLKKGAEVNVKLKEVDAKLKQDFTPLLLALENSSEVVDLLLADQSINVGCIDLKLVIGKDANKRKLVQKKTSK